MIEDELLKWRFKCGSGEALRRIYEKYADFLLTLAIALLNDVHLAEDVLHDVFVNLARSAETFRLSGNLKSYLARCVINRARDQIRAAVRRSDMVQITDTLSTNGDGPEEMIICSEESVHLNAAIAALPYQQREAVVLHVKGGMKFREIAKLQGVTVSTAQGRYRYGLNKLRSILTGEVEK